MTIRPQNDTGAAIRSDSTTADGNMLASRPAATEYDHLLERHGSFPRNSGDGREERRNEYGYDSMRRQTGDGCGRQQRFERVCGRLSHVAFT